eukprot:5128956-Prymnesium_polylepis.1
MLLARRSLRESRQLSRSPAFRTLCARPALTAASAASEKEELPASVATPAAPGFFSHLTDLAWPERHGIASGVVLLSASSAISLVFPRVMGQ